MSTYSEKSQRALDKYTRKLVRSQPRWLRELFNTGRVFFTLEDDNSLGIACENEIPEHQKESIARFISKYMEQHPSVVFKTLEVQ